MPLIEEYRTKHQHPLNRVTHMIGIPLIVVSIGLVFYRWQYGLLLFTIGWSFQFAGHWIEGSWPAFFDRPIHLLTGPYWWLKRVLHLK